MKKILFNILLFFLIFPSFVYGQEGLLKVRIDRFDGGMNSFGMADSLQPNQFASLSNVILNRPGVLSKRKGQDLFNTDTGSTAFTGVGRFDPDATTSYLVTASGTRVARSTLSASTWTLANPNNALTTGKTTEFVQADDLLFVLNGFDNTAWYDGATWDQGGTYPTSPPVATTGAWLRNYLFLAGATTENDWVYVSNNLVPQTFTASDIIKINTGDGQKIQHLEPFRLDELIVYKERSIFVLDISGSAISGWTVQPISTVIGTIAPKSVVSLGNDHWFLSSEPIAVRSLVRTEFDKILVNRISDSIQDIFDGTGRVTINKTHISKATAILFDNKYFIAVPTGTSTVNNLIAVFDFITSGWSLISGWFPSDWVVVGNRLFYIDANDGSVIECFASDGGDFGEGPFVLTSATSPTQAIDYVVQSRIIDFDQPENFKGLDALEVEFDPTGNYNADVYINLDNEGWTSIGTVSLAAYGLTLPFTLPSPLSNTGVARKTFHLQKYDEVKDIQIMIRQNWLDQEVNLRRITIFARSKPWRRE